MIKINFSGKQEKFLILQASDHGTAGFMFALDEEKNLHFKKFWPEFSWSKVSRLIRRHLEHWKIIVVADSSVATTMSYPLSLVRDSKKDSISAPELENLLGQALVKVWNECRSEASKKLGLDELDTIIIDQSVTRFKIDGHRVVNPIGFRAEKIEAVLDLTITNRLIFEDWKNFFGIGDENRFFFTESAKAILAGLKRAVPLPINLLVLRSHRADGFVLGDKKSGLSIKRQSLSWGTNQIIGALSSAWGLNLSSSLKVYQKFLASGLAPKTAEALGKILKPAIRNLTQEINHQNFKGTVYLDSDIPLPFVFPYRSGKITLEELPDKSILSDLGFSIEDKDWPFKSKEIFTHLAPFVEFYYNNRDSAINHWLKRRIHWLGSSI